MAPTRASWCSTATRLRSSARPPRELLRRRSWMSRSSCRWIWMVRRSALVQRDFSEHRWQSAGENQAAPEDPGNLAGGADDPMAPEVDARVLLRVKAQVLVHLRRPSVDEHPVTMLLPDRRAGEISA